MFSQEAALQQIYDLVPDANWDLGLRVWRQFFEFPREISSLPKPKAEKETPETEDTDTKTEQGDCSETDSKTNGATGGTPITEGGDAATTPDGSTEPEVKKPKVLDPDMPYFRATCYRSGGKHIFQSPQAAIHFGGAVQDYFGWNVNLKNFDIETVLTVEGNHVYLSIALTKESLHHRNLILFGPTSLRPTIAYGMLR